MAKKLVCTTALFAALAFLLTGMALAQRPVPTATIHEQGLARPTGGNRVVPPGLVPAYCSPCLFYGGDGDPNNPNADGLWDNNSADFGIDGRVYNPFNVPVKTGKCGGACEWSVSGLFAALELSPHLPVPPTDAVYVVLDTNPSGQDPTTLPAVCKGTDPAPTFTPTGRIFFTYFEEYAMEVAVTGCTLTGKGKSGTEYWMNVTPEFGATGTYQLSYESNVPDSPPPNALGTEPVDQSCFWAPSFGYPTCTNTTQLTGTPPLHIFSAGVEGTLVKK